MEIIQDLLRAFFGWNTITSPLYLVAFAAVAWVIYLLRGVTGGFIAFLLPKDIWSHKSTRLDIILFIMGGLISGFGLIARFSAAPAFAIWISARLPWPPFEGVSLSPVLLAVIFWVVNDFGVYWVHRIHHQMRILWPFHAVHHSAEVMTPITAYRQHPLGLLIIVSIQSCIMGVVLGVIVGTLDPQAATAEIIGINAFAVIAVIAMANFHHSHIWISFGPIVERLIISPAQHQIHHSTNPAHYNRNYGGTLAIWDWVFGTLYLTGDTEVITLGLTEKGDAPLMTHRLDLILIDPVIRALRAGR